MRLRLVGGWTLGLLVALAAVAQGQWFGWDARSTGMGGVVLRRSGGLSALNVAYRAVPAREGEHGAKITLPIPLGIFQALKDSAAFDVNTAYFNPVALANYILNPPVFYVLKKPPIPDNDVFIFIGKDSLFVDLGATKDVIPSDEVKVAGVNRLVNLGAGFLDGFYAGVMLWEHHRLGVQLNDNLLNFLLGQPAQHNTVYAFISDETAQMGVAPGVSYSHKLADVGGGGLYGGAGVNYYMGLAHARAFGLSGIQTGDTIFSGGNPVRPDVGIISEYSKPGSLGHGLGVDFGFTWVSDRIEFGMGVNDVSTTLKWPKSYIDSLSYDTVTNSFVSSAIAKDVERSLRVPTTFMVNAAFEVGEKTTVGAEIRNAGFGTVTRVGLEHRIGPLALRAGVNRDLRKLLQFAAGTGIRFGPFSIDVAVASNSNSLSTTRGWLLASSISVY